MNEPSVHTDHLPYVSQLETRALDSINLVVIHCTELPDLATAREYGERIRYRESGTGNSGHFYIERNGHIEEWVPPMRIAHHVRGYNESSIGIELDNPGRFPRWFHSRHQAMSNPYPSVQLESLAGLLIRLCRAFPTIEWITGHDRLDRTKIAASDDPAIMVSRKKDPGPLFPWKEVLSLTSLKFMDP